MWRRTRERASIRRIPGIYWGREVRGKNLKDEEMKQLAWMAGVVLGVTLLPGGLAAQTDLLGGDLAAQTDDGFAPLFNGKDLDGWQGDERLWRAEDGEIVGSTEGVTIKHNTFLSTEKTYGDFVLRVKVKLRNHNSGVQFRGQQKDDYVVTGYQADMAEQKYFGMLYEEKGRGFMPYWKALSPEEQAAVHAASKPGEWNAFEITCQGDHVKIVLNGKVTCDMEDPDGAKRGVVAFQLHQGPEMEVRFKDIALKRLDAEGEKP